jgi:hypothetical protein
MKQYPSIESGYGQSFVDFQAHVFDKLDGSNLRFEWSRKQGWHKFGTRYRLFDKTDPVFAPAIPIWNNMFGEPMAKIAIDNRWQRVVAFAEFWGPGSLGGLHDPNTSKQLTLFDVSPYKQSLLEPREFLKLFSHLPIPNYLGKLHWTRDFVRKVYEGEIGSVTFEGVVGKAASSHGSSHPPIMFKAKTKAWLDAIMTRYGEVEGKKIIES